MLRTIIIHIGTPKTGTTTIQDTLAANRQLLLQSHFAFPEFAGKTCQINLEAYAANFERELPARKIMNLNSNDRIEKFRKKLEKQAALELGSLGDDIGTIVFSNEGLCSLKTPEELEILKALLAPFAQRFEILVYLRRQDRNAVSNYTSYLKTGGTREKVFLKYKDTDEPYLFYDRLLDLWATVFGRDSVKVRRFETRYLKDGDLIADFFGAIGLSPTVNLARGQSSNPSLTLAACEFLRQMNPQFPRFVDGTPNPVRGPLRPYLEENFPGPGRKPVRAEAEQFCRLFDRSNERVRGEWFPSETSLFDVDFDDYPEKDEVADLDFSDAVEVAATLWSELMKENLALRTKLHFTMAKLALEQDDRALAINNLKRCLELDGRHSGARRLFDELSEKTP